MRQRIDCKTCHITWVHIPFVWRNVLKLYNAWNNMEESNNVRHGKHDRTRPDFAVMVCAKGWMGDQMLEVLMDNIQRILTYY